MKTAPLTPLGSIKGDTWERIYDYTVEHGLGSVVSAYPIQADAQVKATTYYANGLYMPYFCTNPALADITGAQINTSWLSAVNVVTNQRFHIDLGVSRVITKVRYVNGHNGSLDATIDTGAKNFTLWGSNSPTAFAELTYGTDTGWTQLTAVDAVTGLSQLTKFDGGEEFLNVTNSTAYRYYAFKFADTWVSTSYMSVRRIELQCAQVSSLTISGLNGDVDEEYILESKVVNGYNGAAYPYFRLNNDSGANYGYQYVDGANSTASAARATNDQAANVGYNSAINNISLGSSKIFAKSGFVRTIITDCAWDITGTTVTYSRLFANSWNNTADNITSLVIAASQTGGIGVGSSFQLYRKTRRS